MGGGAGPPPPPPPPPPLPEHPNTPLHNIKKKP